jgi:hypothetical protein
MSSLDDLRREFDHVAIRRKAAQEEVQASTTSVLRHMWFTSVVAGVTVGLLFGLIGWLFLF